MQQRGCGCFLRDIFKLQSAYMEERSVTGMPSHLPDLSALASVLPVGGQAKKRSLSESDQPRDVETIREKDAVESWQREFELDVMNMRADLIEAVREDPSPDTPDRLEWSAKDEKQSRDLEAARNHKFFINPRVPDNPRLCAANAMQRLPLGLTHDQFADLVKGLHHMKNVVFVFSAMPVEPVQGQYTAIPKERPCVLVHYSIRKLTLQYADLKNDQGELFFKQLEGAIAETTGDSAPKLLTEFVKNSFVRNDNLCDRIEAWRSFAMPSNVYRGGSNYGYTAPPIVVDVLRDVGLFNAFNTKMLAIGDGDKVEGMARHTGIWMRRNKDPIADSVLSILEAYYTLRGAVMGVCMPVYALDITDKTKMHVYLEHAYSSLSGPDEYDGEDKVTRFVNSLPGFKAQKERAISRFLTKRFASNSLALGEVRLLLTDSKPGNFLFQKSWRNMNLGTHTVNAFPACVMATDIDPVYSFFFNENGAAEVNKMSPMDQTEPTVDTDCVRFCNDANFIIVPLCVGGRGLVQVARDDILNQCRLRLHRFEGSAPLCKKLLEYPTLKEAHNSHNNPTVLEDARNSKLCKTLSWEDFVKGLAMLVATRVWRYGLRHVIDEKGNTIPSLCEGPLRLVEYQRGFMGPDSIIAKVVRWQMQETARLNRPKAQMSSGT